MASEIQKSNSALPAHLQGVTKEKFGNIDSTDLIIPRVKLLQAISPEIDAYPNAKKGEFWHTIASESLGPMIRGIPILVRKSYVLWAPRSDDRGILARADDGLHWNHEPGMEFEVKPKNSPHKVKYVLGETVHTKVDGYPALSEFGSSIPGNADSPPAAALTYQFLWFFPDYADMSPAIIINTRSSVKPAMDLISKIDMKPVPSYAQLYNIGVKVVPGDEGPYNNYTYVGAGYAEADDFERAKALYTKLKVAGWKANDDTPEEDKGEGGDVRVSEKGHKRSKTDTKDVPF